MIQVNRGFNDAYIRNELRSAITYAYKLPEGNRSMITVMAVSLFDSVIPTVAQWNAMGFAEKNQVMITHDHTVHIPAYHQVSPDIRYSYNAPYYPAYTEVLDVNSNAIGFDIDMSILDRSQCLLSTNVTWFMLAFYDKTNIPTTDIPTSPTSYAASWRAIWGTVGLTGSGADMELPTVAVTSGQELVFRDVSIELPRQFA